MATIIDGGQVKSVGNKLKDYADSLGNKITELEDIIEKVDSAWQGEDKVKYVNNMREKLIATLKELKDIIDQNGNYLIGINNVYAEMDSAFARKSISV